MGECAVGELPASCRLGVSRDAPTEPAWQTAETGVAWAILDFGIVLRRNSAQKWPDRALHMCAPRGLQAYPCTDGDLHRRRSAGVGHIGVGSCGCSGRVVISWRPNRKVISWPFGNQDQSSSCKSARVAATAVLNRTTGWLLPKATLTLIPANVALTCRVFEQEDVSSVDVANLPVACLSTGRACEKHKELALRSRMRLSTPAGRKAEERNARS